jgi:Carboxypeptidase regulatory-like domain/TonB-dependent Receptor Plug Domain
MSRRSIFLLTICFCLFAFGPVFGQETTGGIEGVIKDAQGAVVPNVTVTITTAKASSAGTTTTGIGAGFRRTITTDGEGFFRALQVPPGNYDVVTEAAQGFGVSRYENVLVSIGQNTQLSIIVNAGTSVNTVDVVATEAAPVDTTSSGLQETINAQSIELIPKSTGFAGLLKTIPGTRPESRTGGYSVDGSSGGENVFVIDGQEITNYRTGTLNETYNIPTQLVQEVQVRSTGFEAAYGGATGGVVSVVTRGGSDAFHGEEGIQFEVPKLNGKERPLLNRLTFTNPFVEAIEYLNPVKARGNNYFPTFNLSGPLVKKRLWFYTSYTPRIFNTEVDTQYFTNAPPATRTFVTSETYSRKRTYQYAFARLDGNVTDKLRLTSTFLWNPVVDEGSIPLNSFTNISSSAFGFTGVPTANYGGSIGVLTGNDYTSQQGGRQSSNLVTVSGVWTPRSNIVVDARYSRNFLNEKNGNYFVPTLLPQVSACSGTPSFPCVTTGANSLTTKDVSVREAFDYAVAYLFNAGGTHEMKGGYQVFSIFNDVQSGNNAIGQLRFNFGQPISTTIPGVQATPGAIGSGSFRRQGTNGSGSNLNEALFIQDKYQPNRRLTFNLGVRVERENLPSFNQYPSAIKFGWGDKIAPRLGIAYDLMGDGRTRIFASYGKFYDRLKFALPRGLFGGDVFLEDYFEIFPGDVVTNFNIGTIVGNFSGPSICPATGTITAGVRSRCQRNLRVNANEPGASPFLNGAVDPDLRPFQQTEVTFGVEHQLSNNFVFRARFTHKNVDEAVEDAGIVNALGSEAYIIGNPGRGLHLQTLQALNYTKSTRPQRVYDGLEFVLERRFAKNWYFNANYTLSQLWGNYSGLSSSDEPHLVDGRLAPGVTRAFDLPFIGFTVLGNPDNGPLQTDRPHVFNIYGSYSFDWMGSKSNRTDISGFQTITSGTPQTTTIYGASTVTPQIYIGRNDMGRSPVYSQTDLAFTHRYKFGSDGRFTIAADLNFLNLFDQDTVTGYYTTKNPSTAPVNQGALGLSAVAYANGYTTGTLANQFAAYLVAAQNRIDNRYGMPFLYQSPRQVRFGFRFLF